MTSELEMTTRRPYLIRAMYQWIVDNHLTPHLLVNTEHPGVKVPVAHIDDNGQIVLNVAPPAIQNLEMGLRVVTFNAAFPGLKANIVLPIQSIQAIYAVENGEGSLFEMELDGVLAPESGTAHLHVLDTPSASDQKTASKKTASASRSQSSKSPQLRILKKPSQSPKPKKK